MSAWVLFAAACACGLGPSGQLAFVSGTTQDTQRVCVLDAATGTLTPVGPGRYDADPTWSPDGQWLAFSTAVDKGVAIAVARADGSDLRILLHAKAWNRYPRWDPRSKALAYVSFSGETTDPNRTCTVCDLASGAETTWGGELKTVLRPVWMPNVLLLRALAPETGLMWGKEQVTAPELLERLAASGALVTPAAVGEPGKMTTDIFFLDPSTASPLFQAALPNQGAYSEWCIEPSPNGAAVAMESNDGGDREIFVFSKRGMADVSNHRAADWNPVWSPDNQWLAFESLRTGRRGVVPGLRRHGARLAGRCHGGGR